MPQNCLQNVKEFLQLAEGQIGTPLTKLAQRLVCRDEASTH